MIRRPPRSTLLTHSFPTRRSSDLQRRGLDVFHHGQVVEQPDDLERAGDALERDMARRQAGCQAGSSIIRPIEVARLSRSEEHTSELQSLMRISYAVFCLKKKKKQQLVLATLKTLRLYCKIC